MGTLVRSVIFLLGIIAVVSPTKSITSVLYMTLYPPMPDTLGAVHETLASVNLPLPSTVTLVGGGKGSGFDDKVTAAGGRKVKVKGRFT